MNSRLYKSTPGYSDVTTPGRSSWKPLKGMGSYSFNISLLSDIISKRECLYNEYFLNKGYNIHLPEYLRATPTNTLFKEIKNSYKFTDPTTFSNEISRDFYYANNVFNNIFLTSFLSTKVSPVFLTKLINNSFYYFLNSSSYDLNISSNDNLKSQFRPIKKGVTNMIRLQATGAIALPTEIRIHILASSRDIIHS
jgi:hypothetical protein